MMNLHTTTLGKIKRTSVIVLSFFPFLLFSSCDVLTNVLGNYAGTGGLTNAEIVSGLKEALKEGAQFASANASKQDGFLNNKIVDIRILMPPELRRAEKNIRGIPLVGNRVVDNFVESMNRGAEKAAKEAAPIFVKAITSMSINDAVSILRGDSTAATNYLNRTTSEQLRAAFQPVIRTALNEVGATKYYDALQDAVSAYNRSPLSNNINLNELPVLEEYAAERAIDGLFKLVAVEEKKIREDPLSQGKEIIRKVFGASKTPQGIGG